MAGASVLLTACSGDGDGLDANGQPLSDSPQARDDQFSQVQEIFTSRCIACHSGAGAPEGLILTEGLSYDSLVNVQSSQQPDLLRVLPNNAEASYLLHKVRGDNTIDGRQMPLNGPPYLSQAQIDTITDWINAGAPDTVDPGPLDELVADIDDFTGYRNWTSIDYSIGPVNPALGSAHQAQDDNFSRRVYRNDIAERASDGNFPIGSILVKEVVTFQNGEREFPERNGITAMVKRGNGFNEANNGWEWFVLADDLSEIQGRGGDLGMCGGCHQQAEFQDGGGDYVFPHPSELIVESDYFVNYEQWSLIDERDDDNPLLGGLAHNGATRKVYQRQLYANPDTTTQGYPVGTSLVKETVLDGEIVELTAMVKRGGNYDEDSRDWEWFVLNPNTAEIRIDDGSELRGSDLMMGMCTGCHMGANPESGNGIDFVFKHEDAPLNNNEEFVASLSDFSNYTQWQVVDYTISDINPAIGGGHQGQATNYSRRTYVNDIAENADGNTYPRGSILIKEVTTWESGQREFSPQLGLIAMVKRAGNFNTDHNGWEWFELSNDNSQIIGRGGDYRNNGCNNCHVAANTQTGGHDYVFQHRSEFIAQSSDFSDYRDWPLIDERSDQNNLLGGMAHKGDDPNAVRRVYKRQLYAAPEEEVFGFPVGTIIVKEVTQNNEITELAAMVKRGGTFNEDHQNWEWLMLDPSDATIAIDDGNNEMRGADLMQGMCNSCHMLAEHGSNEGTDYVFFHANDPVNNN